MKTRNGRRRRKSPRRKRFNKQTPLASGSPRFSQMTYIPKARCSHTKTSQLSFGSSILAQFIERIRSNAWRVTSEEKRYNEKMAMEDPEITYNNIRRAAEVHRQVRHHARKFIRPGLSMTEIAEYIEDGTRSLVEESGLDAGVGFPTGLSLNNCAAHYTPNAGDTTSVSYAVWLFLELIEDKFYNTVTFSRWISGFMSKVASLTRRSPSRLSQHTIHWSKLSRLRPILASKYYRRLTLSNSR